MLITRDEILKRARSQQKAWMWFRWMELALGCLFAWVSWRLWLTETVVCDLTLECTPDPLAGWMSGCFFGGAVFLVIKALVQWKGDYFPRALLELASREERGISEATVRGKV